MKITIYQNREVYKEETKIGNDSENKVETLDFEFPEEYRDFTKYIEFQIKSGKYVDLSSGKSSYLGKYVGFTVNGKGKGNPNTKMIDKKFGPLSIYGEYSKGSKMFNLNIGIHTTKVKNAAKKGKAYILKKLK